MTETVNNDIGTVSDDARKEENKTLRITRQNNAFFRHLLFLAVLIAIACIIFHHLNFWVGSFLGAITIYIVFRNPMFYLVERVGIPRWIASLLIVIAVTLILIGFGYLMIRAVGSEVPKINMNGFMDGINDIPAQVNEALGMSLIPEDIVSRSDNVIKSMLSSVLSTTYSFAANAFMMLIVLYFMLTSGRRMEAKIWLYAPFRERSLCLIKREVKNMIYSNAVGIPVILVLQSLVATLIYWILGFGNYFFWGLLTGICGLIPIVGTSIVYIPVAVYMAAAGDLLNAAVLLAYGMIVISNADNVFRIIMMRKVADAHPLVVIFGVILGIPLFGFWGIIFGPLFISGFMLLVKIYYVEYGLIEQPTDEQLRKPPHKNIPRHFARIAEKAITCSGKKSTNPETRSK